MSTLQSKLAGLERECTQIRADAHGELANLRGEARRLQPAVAQAAAAAAAATVAATANPAPNASSGTPGNPHHPCWETDRAR